jgi:small subunit ribosomal protein S20
LKSCVIFSIFFVIAFRKFWQYLKKKPKAFSELKKITTFAPSLNYFKELKMANHQSAEKRIRQNETSRLENKYYAKTARNAVKKLRHITAKPEAEKLYPEVAGMLDKLAKKHVIHKNKASNLKSSLAKHVNRLS